MKIKGCLMHKSDIWSTPKEIYLPFMKCGYFDPCPLNPKFDGLKIDWGEKAFVNPPYSKIKLWVKKAIEQKNKGCVIEMLLPARTDTKWFKELHDNNFEFTFITGRLKFGDSKFSAPFPSMFVHGGIYVDYPYMMLSSVEKYMRQQFGKLTLF